MKATSARQKPSGASATSMNGRLRPRGVWNVSLQGPVTSGSVKAKSPSDPRTTAISARESVNWPSSGGRYAEVAVSESARPNAPRPSVHGSARLRCCGSGTMFAGSVDIGINFYRFTRSWRR